jgi:hypothetical protein
VARSSSSTNKAARLAEKGKGRKLRFQGGVLFPIIVSVVLVLGFSLILYARETVPAADSSSPTINEHWHGAYGFYLCDQWYQLNGNLEERNASGQFTNTNFLRTGIHSHDDGVMHWHPNSSLGVGRNAKLGVFLDTYDVGISNDTLSFPDQNRLGGLAEYVEGETKCDGEDAELSVVAWDNFTDIDLGTRFIANMDEVRFEFDAMVFAIVFAPDSAPRTMPPWAQNLPQLGAADTGQALPQAPQPTDGQDGAPELGPALPDITVPATPTDTGG